MSNPDKTKWNSRYVNGNASTPLAAEILAENLHLLPDTGSALDLACGRGGNALCLADQGLDTHAWDLSDVVISQLGEQALQRGLSIHTACRDVSVEPPEPQRFDVIVVSRFLDRDLFPALKHAVTRKGLVFYQTFIKDKVADTGPSNPDYRLDENELLSFFNDWTICVYREEGSIGNTKTGFRNQAALIAQKP